MKVLIFAVIGIAFQLIVLLNIDSTKWNYWILEILFPIIICLTLNQVSKLK